MMAEMYLVLYSLLLLLKCLDIKKQHQNYQLVNLHSS